MKRKIITIIAYVFALIFLLGFSSPQRVSASEKAGTKKDDTIHILLVGNSLTRLGVRSEERTVQSHLKKIAKASGKKVKIKTLAHGAAKWKNYAGLSKKKKKYRAEFLNVLRSEDWDYVILQEYNRISYTAFEKDMVPAVKWLNSKIEKHAPKAKVLLYMTCGHDYEYQKKNESVIVTSYDMERYIGAAYTNIGKNLDLDVIPVGIQFYRASVLYPEIRLMGEDKKHPTKAGYFLVASCIYYEIFKSYPVLNESMLAHAGIDAIQAEKLMSLLGAGIKANVTEKSMQIGDSFVMKVKSIQGEPLSQVYYESMDDKVAQVESTTGKVTAVGEGKTVIVAETSDGRQAFCTVYVAYRKPEQVKVKVAARQTAEKNRVNVRLTWDGLEGASYRIYRARSKNGTYQYVATVQKNQYTDRGVKTGHDWYYKISITTGFDKNREKVSHRVKISLPKVKGLKVQVLSKEMVKLSWTKSKKADGYMIYRSASKNGRYVKIAETTSYQACTYTDADRKRGKTYYYKVVAYGKD